MGVLRSQSLLFCAKNVSDQTQLMVRFFVWLIVGFVLFFGPLNAQAVSPAVPEAYSPTQQHDQKQEHLEPQKGTALKQQFPESQGAIYAAAASRPTACQKVAPLTPSGIALNKAGFVARHEAPQYYQVYGTSLDQIRIQLKACSPSSYFGYTAYRLTWQYYTTWNSDSTCSITNVAVGIHTTVQYPAWQRGGASAAVEQRWNKMMSSLVTHEQGHVARSEFVARELHSALSTLPPASCGSIGDNADAMVARYSKKLQQQHTHYDDNTAHGTTQGAAL